MTHPTARSFHEAASTRHAPHAKQRCEDATCGIQLKRRRRRKKRTARRRCRSAQRTNGFLASTCEMAREPPGKLATHDQIQQIFGRTRTNFGEIQDNLVELSRTMVEIAKWRCSWPGAAHFGPMPADCSRPGPKLAEGNSIWLTPLHVPAGRKPNLVDSALNLAEASGVFFGFAPHLLQSGRSNDSLSNP